MPSEKLFQKLQSVFDDVFVNDIKVTPSLSANDVAEWDSFTHISLIVGIEKAFSIQFETGEVVTFQNVGEMAGAISKKLEPEQNG